MSLDVRSVTETRLAPPRASPEAVAALGGFKDTEVEMSEQMQLVDSIYVSQWRAVIVLAVNAAEVRLGSRSG
jgi:hypothetical protein